MTTVTLAVETLIATAVIVGGLSLTVGYIIGLFHGEERSRRR